MRRIVILVLFGALASVRAGEPDTYLLEYQSFVPNRYFSNTAGGPERQLLTVINTVSEWKSFWASIEPRMDRDIAQTRPHPLPRIDFSRYSLLVAALGENGGRSVAIESIHNFGAKITVLLVALHPGPGCVVTMDIRYPIALALIARTDKPVDFSVTNAVMTCENKPS